MNGFYNYKEYNLVIVDGICVKLILILWDTVLVTSKLLVCMRFLANGRKRFQNRSLSLAKNSVDFINPWVKSKFKAFKVILGYPDSF